MSRFILSLFIHNTSTIQSTLKLGYEIWNLQQIHSKYLFWLWLMLNYCILHRINRMVRRVHNNIIIIINTANLPTIFISLKYTVKVFYMTQRQNKLLKGGCMNESTISQTIWHSVIFVGISCWLELSRKFVVQKMNLHGISTFIILYACKTLKRWASNFQFYCHYHKNFLPIKVYVIKCKAVVVVSSSEKFIWIFWYMNWIERDFSRNLNFPQNITFSYIEFSE